MFKERLETIASRLEGARLVALIAADGIPVEVHRQDEDLDVEALAAELVTQVRSIAENHDELTLGSVRQLSITTDRQTLMLGALGGGHFLLLVLRDGVSSGRARFELRRAPLVLDSDLE